MHYVCANIFGAIVFNLRFKIDVVVMIIWSIINSVLTLQVLTASLPHDRKPCEIKVVSNHTCSLHTCVCAGWRRVRVRLSGFRWQGISSTPRGFLKCPIPVRVGPNNTTLITNTKSQEKSTGFWKWIVYLKFYYPRGTVFFLISDFYLMISGSMCAHCLGFNPTPSILRHSDVEYST